MRQNIQTLARVAATALALWALQVGSYSVPVTMQAALLVATVLAVLLLYEFAIRDAPGSWTVGVSGGVFVSIIGAYTIWHALQPPPPTGPLKPAGEPSPRLSCSIKPGPRDLVMAFGTDAMIGHGDGPFTPIKVASCPVLKFQRTPQGLSFKDIAYDYDGDIAFMIKDGVYEPQFILDLKILRPDPSTFILLDRYNQEVIYLRYLNPNAVRIRGRFLCGEAPQAVVRDDAILVGGTRLLGAWSGQRAIPGHICQEADSPKHAFVKWLPP